MMSFWQKNRRRRRSSARSLRTGMVLLAIAASVVFTIFSPPEPSPSGTSGGSARPSSATTAKRAPATKASPRPNVRAVVEREAPARELGGAGCYSHSQAWVNGNLNVRQRPSTAATILGRTPPGERYQVVGSHQGEVYCWIDIDLGWIAVTGYVSANERSASAPAAAPVAAPDSARDAAAVAVKAAVRRAINALNTLVVAPENRCSDYDSDDYPYPQSVEADIVASMGGRIYGPYTGTTFGSTRDTDIEHIVAKSEAHDSGLCAAGEQRRKIFARDLLNLTLASPSVNRHQKSGYDFAEWKPALNACWYADRIILVKVKYGLSVDSREKAALQRTLRSCDSLDMR